MTCEGQAPRSSVSMSDGMPTSLVNDSFTNSLSAVLFSMYYRGQIEDDIRIVYPSRAFPRVSAHYPYHSPPSSHPLLIFPRINPASHASASRTGRGEWSCSFIVYGIEKISGLRGAGAVFGRVESHKRAQNVSMPGRTCDRRI